MAYRDIIRFFELRKSRRMRIEDKDGMLIYDDVMIVKQQKEYLEQLYSETTAT